MKTIALTLTLATASTLAKESSQLFNLRNHHLLRSANDALNQPFETLAHVKTFDEIPVFGGSEFRQSLLEK